MAYFQSYGLFLNPKSMKIHTKTHTFPFCLIRNYNLELPSHPKFHLPYNVHLFHLNQEANIYSLNIYIQSFELGFGNILSLILSEQIQLSTKINFSIKSASEPPAGLGAAKLERPTCAAPVRCPNPAEAREARSTGAPQPLPFALPRPPL